MEHAPLHAVSFNFPSPSGQSNSSLILQMEWNCMQQIHSSQLYWGQAAAPLKASVPPHLHHPLTCTPHPHALGLECKQRCAGSLRVLWGY